MHGSPPIRRKRWIASQVLLAAVLTALADVGGGRQAIGWRARLSTPGRQRGRRRGEPSPAGDAPPPAWLFLRPTQGNGDRRLAGARAFAGGQVRRTGPGWRGRRRGSAIRRRGCRAVGCGCQRCTTDQKSWNTEPCSRQISPAVADLYQGLTGAQQLQRRRQSHRQHRLEAGIRCVAASQPYHLGRCSLPDHHSTKSLSLVMTIAPALLAAAKISWSVASRIPMARNGTACTEKRSVIQVATNGHSWASSQRIMPRGAGGPSSGRHSAARRECRQVAGPADLPARLPC